MTTSTPATAVNTKGKLNQEVKLSNIYLKSDHTCNITETSLCLLGNLRKDLLSYCCVKKITKKKKKCQRPFIVE